MSRDEFNHCCENLMACNCGESYQRAFPASVTFSVRLVAAVYAVINSIAGLNPFVMRGA